MHSPKKWMKILYKIYKIKNSIKFFIKISINNIFTHQLIAHEVKRIFANVFKFHFLHFLNFEFLLYKIIICADVNFEKNGI